jgi:hypothetical protein
LEVPNADDAGESETLAQARRGTARSYGEFPHLGRQKKLLNIAETYDRLAEHEEARTHRKKQREEAG